MGLRHGWEEHSVEVLPALHRRELQERRAPAKQTESYLFELQFRFVRVLNIYISVRNPETAADIQIFGHGSCSELAGLMKVLMNAEIT